MMPAKTPGPRIATRSNSQSNELMEREATMTRNAMERRMFLLGGVLRAAKKAIGMAAKIPIRVTRAAMLIVSHYRWDAV